METNLPRQRQTRNHWTLQLHTPPPVPGILHDNPRNEHTMVDFHHASSVAGHRSSLLQAFKN